jgi:HAD superfamily hydrolase (TIGR01549 family)
LGDRLPARSIQVILFDLDGTLRHSQPAPNDFFFDHAGSFGVDTCLHHRRRAARWVHSYWASSAQLLEDVEIFGEYGEPFWVNYAFRLLQALGCAPSRAAELASEMQRHMRQDYQPVDELVSGVPEMLHRLRRSGFRLGVLSNREVPCDEYLAALGLRDFFHLVLVAGEVDSWKPESEIFFHALRRMAASQDETIYVGDNYYADIIGAQRAGLRGILYDPQGIFDEPGCLSIRSMDELPLLLETDGFK